MSSHYPCHCILPKGRTLYFQNELKSLVVTQDAEIDDKILINYIQGSEQTYFTINELEKKLSFIYSPFLTFLHEADLRTLVYDSFDESEENEQSLEDVRIKELIFNPESRYLLSKVLGIKFISDEMGHGLIVLKNLNRGDILGEYTGLITKQSKSTDSSYSCYYPSTDGGYAINAIEYGNMMRFANHSEESANIKFEAKRIDGIFHILVVTLRDINEGEDLLVNYGQSYWSVRADQPL